LPNFIEKCYYLAELLVAEYRKQNISVTNNNEFVQCQYVVT